MNTAVEQLDEAFEMPRRSRLLPALGIVILVGVAVAATYLATHKASSSATGAATVKRTFALADVATRDLTETASYDGTIGFGDSRAYGTASAGATATAGAASSGSSIVTRVATVGSIVTRGHRLFAVDEQPTILLYGSFPMYRALSSTVTAGPDVLQLERNLKALGYTPSGMAVDSTWDADTTTAVNAWEAHWGLTQDGTVPVSRVVFSRSKVRIASAATVGDAASSSIVTVTDTKRVATVSLSTSDAATVSVGEKVNASLPSGKTITAVVTALGTSAATTSSSSSSSGQGGSQNQSGSSSTTSSSTVTVSVAIPEVAELKGLATAPVTIAFATRRAPGVLSVPTNALLTLADGSFAVEVSDGGARTHLVRVTAGLFAAGGFVQVTPEGGPLEPGAKVLVPA
jgi:peptidoglycan hydrolase-like protein with peptidoglycan-binding domain